MGAANAFPLPQRELLKSAYVGKSLHDVPVPSAILDLSKIKRNCGLMLGAVKELDVQFRAHIKTHKTVELTQYQVGHDCKDVRLVVSTILELEQVTPLLKEYRQQGATINITYGIPPGASLAPRLADALRDLGRGGLTLMIDHPAQLETVRKVYDLSGELNVRVFLKIDSGYHRAGLAPTSQTLQDLVGAVLQLESAGILHLLGFYSHNSLSYGGNSPTEAMDNLRVEVDACTQAALSNTPASYVASRSSPLAISCGASPTALSLQNLLQASPETAATSSATALRSSLSKAKDAHIHFEIHAGVYPTLDMQQISTSSRDLGVRPEDNIAFSVLTEVCSTYPDRTDLPEALINAGCIALAREPCKSYRGHGVVTPYNMPADYDPYSLESRIIVDRVSQEHGLLQWEDKKKTIALPVEYGKRLQIWPNHACITGSHFGWYFVVDSGSDQPNIVKDVWVRWRGW